ncbi:MAG: hypothetical protein HZR80_09165 [Candidatus Heimdallarchaeota archaeon]
MSLLKIKRNKKGVSSIISTLLITSIMVTSLALTYAYIIPTMNRGNMNATIATSALFLVKMDGAVQTMFYDGVGSSRSFEVDAFSGNLEFISYGINFRAFIDGSLYLPIPGLEYGVAKLTIPGDTAIMPRNSKDYIKGSPYYSPVVTTGDETGDPGTITLERPTSDLYLMELWYRLVLLVKDTGLGGTIDVTLVAVEINAAESVRGLHSGTYNMKLNKTAIIVNPTIHGFNANGDPITTSGDDFYLTVNKGSGPIIVYSSSGSRTRVSFSLIIYSFDIITTKLD